MTRTSYAPGIIPVVPIERSLLLLRGERVILDADLAARYGVTTKALNQAIKRNRERFPTDFAFSLTAAEKIEVVTKCDHLRSLRFSPSNPTAFTEHGAIMAASILKSSRAVSASVELVRAFIRLRRLLATHADLTRKLAELEQRYDAQFRVVFDAIRALMEPVEDDAPLCAPSRPRRPRESARLTHVALLKAMHSGPRYQHPQEFTMTARKAETRKHSVEHKSLSLQKRTLRDLSARREGPRGGFIMKDSIIVRTSGR